jgi:hypothetical protein
LQSCHALLGPSPFLCFPASLWTRGLPSQDRKEGPNVTAGPPTSQRIRFTPSTSYAHAIQIITCCSSSSHRSVPKKRTRTLDWDRSLKAKATPLLPIESQPLRRLCFRVPTSLIMKCLFNKNQPTKES